MTIKFKPEIHTRCRREAEITYLCCSNFPCSKCIAAHERTEQNHINGRHFEPEPTCHGCLQNHLIQSILDAGILTETWDYEEIFAELLSDGRGTQTVWTEAEALDKARRWQAEYIAEMQDEHAQSVIEDAQQGRYDREGN